MSWEFDFLYMIQKLHNPVLDKIMIVLTKLGDAGILWIAIALILLIPKKYRRAGLQMLITMAITYVIGNLILKNLIARERPCWIDTTVPLLIASPSGYSFPSGHSMNGFASALALFLNDKKLGIPALVLAAAIAFSRLYHFVHFPTDVLGGILIATVVALLVNLFFKKFIKNL